MSARGPVEGDPVGWLSDGRVASLYIIAAERGQQGEAATRVHGSLANSLIVLRNKRDGLEWMM